MVNKINIFILDVMFELYGIMHKWFINQARKYIGDMDQHKKFRYWVRKADKCIEKRDDILDKLFT